MCLLFETIKIFKKEIYNLNYHNQRLNNARNELFGLKNKIKLEEQIIFPADIGNSLYKCRVIYSKGIEKIEFEKYERKNIKSLKLVNSENIDYSYKYFDRSELNYLQNARGNCSEIIIVKNRLLSDTTFANLCFLDDKKWFTPDTPLLKGTKRQQLLDEGKIHETKIRVKDIYKYEKISLINAMNDIGNIELDISSVEIIEGDYQE
ncbi:MAG: aminotransferase class IV family protein [Bacteroidota bacterium]|nr:aminotransferase class IV family protein [Bacteroidota bacterium]